MLTLNNSFKIDNNGSTHSNRNTKKKLLNKEEALVIGLAQVITNFLTSSSDSLRKQVYPSGTQDPSSGGCGFSLSSGEWESTNSYDEGIIISRWKAEVSKVLPPGCIVAKMILKESDILERSEAVVKIPMYLRIIKEELDKLELDSHL